MTDFGRHLKNVRLSLGFKSAKSFFDRCKKGRKLGFNYSYYVRIENGDTIPSVQVVREIASLLPPNDGDSLISAYCRSLFPDKPHLFADYDRTLVENIVKLERQLLTGQKELSKRQVSLLARDRETYHLFLLTTLARKPVSIANIAKSIPTSKLAASIKTLKDADLLVENEEREVSSSSIELKFPSADDADLKRIYEKLDEWDRVFGDVFGFETLIHKLMTRRISFRYLSLIKGQLELLFDMIKAADETDLKYNESVVHLSVSMKVGKIPG